MILNKSHYFTLWDIGNNPYVIEKYYKDYFPWTWTDYMDILNVPTYYIEYFGNYCFTTFNLDEYIPKYTLNLIRKKEAYLLLHNTGHGYHESIENIYTDVILKYDLPFENVIVSSESADMHKAGEFFSQKLNLPMLRYFLATEFEAYYSYYARTNQVQYNKFELKKYDKKFISLNGFYRNHRAALISLFDCLDLLDKGLISYNIKDGGRTPSETLDFMHEFFDNIPEVKTMLDNNKDRLLSLNSILLDRPFNTSDNLAVVMPEHDRYFNDTYFSVITETNFPPFDPPYHKPDLPDRVGRLLSEKIFRTIYFKHPFIMVSNPHILKLLKYLGYKTFEGLIDESYDDELDNSKRLWKIAKEVKRLSDLSDDEVCDFINKAQSICEFNFNVLKDKNNFCKQLPLC